MQGGGGFERLLLDGFGLDAAEGVGDHDVRQVGRPTLLRFELEESLERIRDDGDGRDSALLKGYRGVDTPRRAGSSVG
ncbi:MAG: hypothetical protein OXH07_03570 [Chloroflexi bacterium]|nr:hypothetical protein [Chloroflexota bacterium]